MSDPGGLGRPPLGPGDAGPGLRLGFGKLESLGMIIGAGAAAAAAARGGCHRRPGGSESLAL